MENNITSKETLAEIRKIYYEKRENVGWNGKSLAKGERLVLTRKEQQKTGRQGAAGSCQKGVKKLEQEITRHDK